MPKTERKPERINGVCTCQNDLWHWYIEDNEMVLICTQCGKEAHFYGYILIN